MLLLFGAYTVICAAEPHQFLFGILNKADGWRFVVDKFLLVLDVKILQYIAFTGRKLKETSSLGARPPKPIEIYEFEGCVLLALTCEPHVKIMRTYILVCQSLDSVFSFEAQIGEY